MENKADNLSKNNNKKAKTFKDYYADPEYRRKHLAYISERVKCNDCGIETARCNMSKHKKTVKHIKISEARREISYYIDLKKRFKKIVGNNIDKDKIDEVFDSMDKDQLANMLDIPIMIIFHKTT